MASMYDKCSSLCFVCILEMPASNELGLRFEVEVLFVLAT